jgi:hypothetical protein
MRSFVINSNTQIIVTSLEDSGAAATPKPHLRKPQRVQQATVFAVVAKP